MKKYEMLGDESFVDFAGSLEKRNKQDYYENNKEKIKSQSREYYHKEAEQKC